MSHTFQINYNERILQHVNFAEEEEEDTEDRQSHLSSATGGAAPVSVASKGDHDDVVLHVTLPVACVLRFSLVVIFGHLQNQTLKTSINIKHSFGVIDFRVLSL